MIITLWAVNLLIYSLIRRIGQKERQKCHPEEKCDIQNSDQQNTDFIRNSGGINKAGDKLDSGEQNSGDIQSSVDKQNTVYTRNYGCMKKAGNKPDSGVQNAGGISDVGVQSGNIKERRKCSLKETCDIQNTLFIPISGGINGGGDKLLDSGDSPLQVHSYSMRLGCSLERNLELGWVPDEEELFLSSCVSFHLNNPFTSKTQLTN